MSWFPATKVNISNWEYFSVKMTFGDFFDENRERKNDLISFATDLTEDGEMPSVLDEWLQRKLNEGRAKGSIADYLLDKDDYFFSYFLEYLDSRLFLSNHELLFLRGICFVCEDIAHNE